MKDGVDYFPKDTDFYEDDKVRLLRAEFGAKGMYLLDYLLCRLYGRNGYFLPWDRNVQLLVADAVGCGCEPQYISEFIAGATRCSFFNERVRDVFGVLTSAGIQRRYIRMFNSREQIQIIKEYWLLDVKSRKDVPAGAINKLVFISLKSTGNPDKSTGNPDKSTGNPQNKVKDTNVSQNKTKDAHAREDIAAAVLCYENNIGPIETIVFEELVRWLDNINVSLIVYAIEEAVRHRVRNWAYINKIINNHFTSGRTTRIEAEQCKVSKTTKPQDNNKFNDYAQTSEYDFNEIERLSAARLKMSDDTDGDTS